MRKRIYFNMLILLLLCVLLLSSSIGFVFYAVTKKQEITAIKDRATLIADLLNRGINENYINKEYYGSSPYNSPFADFISDELSSARMTIIAPDGTVLLDNKTYADKLENHGGREEFQQAVTGGAGESLRFSATLGSITYYYAVKLDDGNVLRISKTTNSIIGIFASVLPMIIIITVLILLFANAAARKLTNNIIGPINNIDFEKDNTSAYDELLPFIKKIEAQKKEIFGHSAALESRANTIEAITENMKEGLILVDKNGVVLSINASALEIFNVRDGVGKNILQICRDIDLLQKMKLCLSGGNAEMLLEREDKTYNIYLNPVYDGGEISGAVILFLDTTEKYKAEKQRKEFSANVSHELKTPLTTISALSEMIENGMAKKDDIAGFAEKINSGASRLISLIDDILMLSKLDENNNIFDKQDVDLKALALEVTGSLFDKASEFGVALNVTGGGLTLKASKNMIYELLYNLVDNGIKYNKPEGSVTVSLFKEDDDSIIQVSDTGIGIPKEHLERIFERFYRADKSRSKKTGGTGLGLSIVKHIAMAHGGTVSVESVESEGTCVKVTF